MKTNVGDRVKLSDGTKWKIVDSINEDGKLIYLIFSKNRKTHTYRLVDASAWKTIDDEAEYQALIVRFDPKMTEYTNHVKKLDRQKDIIGSLFTLIIALLVYLTFSPTMPFVNNRAGYWEAQDGSSILEGRGSSLIRWYIDEQDPWGDQDGWDDQDSWQEGWHYTPLPRGERHDPEVGYMDQRVRGNRFTGFRLIRIHSITGEERVYYRISRRNVPETIRNR